MGALRLAVDCRNALGEGPLWSPSRQCLFWTDIEGRRLWRYDPAQDHASCIEVPDRLGSMAECRRDARLLCAFEHRLAFLDPDTGAVEEICRVQDDLPTVRRNDGRCDRDGRFVVGGFDSDGQADPKARVYRLDPDLSLHLMEALPASSSSNSICFSPDGRTLYYADSERAEIWAYDYDRATGTAANRRTFHDFNDQPGIPDGSIVDSEGFLWNAQWSGGRVVRFRPDGKVDRVIELPVPQPTCCAFGGPDLSTLYVTSARVGLDAATLAAYPLSGGLFAIETGSRGLPEDRFAE